MLTGYDEHSGLRGVNQPLGPKGNEEQIWKV
jgi:hypothetical protein